MASCNGKRISRKRTFAEEESWFLVQFEDQPDTFRVLNEREVKHLDPEDHEEMEEGETIQAFWSADKKFYEAEILKISDDKNFLLKERRVLETSLRKSAIGKALANDDQSAKKRFKQAEKQPSSSKNSKTTEEEKAKQEAKKAKEAEKLRAEKRRKAEIAAKVAQATKRISSLNQQSVGNPLQSAEVHQEGNHYNHPLSLPAFRKQPQANSSSSCRLSDNHELHDHEEGDNINLPSPATVPVASQKKQNGKRKKKAAQQPTPSSSTPTTSRGKSSQNQQSVGNPHQSTEIRQEGNNYSHPLSLPALRKQPQADSIDLPPPATAIHPVASQKKQNGKRKKETAQRPTPSLSTPTTSRDKSTKKQATHVLSDDEDECRENVVITTSCDNMDCKLLLLENKTLKEKVKKLQGRLDAAVKAKSPTSIVAGKPAAGIVDRELAAEYQMKEFLDGSGIFWYGSQRAICSACTKWEEYVNLVVDIFFPKEVLRVSCARGLNKGRKLKDTVPLCQPIVEAIIGKVCARFQPPPTVAQITGKINQKCTEARRPKRVPLMAMN